MHNTLSMSIIADITLSNVWHNEEKEGHSMTIMGGMLSYYRFLGSKRWINIYIIYIDICMYIWGAKTEKWEQSVYIYSLLNEIIV